MSRRLIVAAFILVAGLPLLAQQGPDGDPDAAQGYVDNVFHHASVDSINLYNGQLTVPIALGPSYPIGPKLKLQLALTYGSRVWEYGHPRFQNPDGASAVLAGDPAVGIGWTFTLGAIKTCSTGKMCYVGPDGSQRAFDIGDSRGPSYLKTSDASQLSLHNVGYPSNGPFEMWDGDGNHYVFNWYVSGFDDLLTDFTHDFGRGRDGWYLTSLTDPFGNGYSVGYRTGTGPCWSYSTSCTYQAMRCTSPSANLWIPQSITLPTNDVITISIDATQMISGFTFPVTGGSSATWSLGYQLPIPYGETCGGSLPYIHPNLRAIQSIQLPNGIGSYQFSYNNPSNCVTSLLTHVQVPTGATVDYLYGTYSFYHGRLAALSQNCHPIAPDPSALVEVSGASICFPSQPAGPPPYLPPGSCTDPPNYLDLQTGVVRRTETVSGSASVTDYVQYAFPFGEQGVPTNNCDTLGTCGQNLTVTIFPPDVDGRRRAKGVLFWSAPRHPNQAGVYAGERTGADIEERVYDSDPTQNVNLAMPICGGAQNPICADHAVRVTQRTFEYDIPTAEIHNRRLLQEREYYGPTSANGTCPTCAYHQVSYSNSGSSTWDGNGRHYNIEAHSGNLGGDFRQVATTWSPTISPWFPNLFEKRISSDATGSLNQYFDYDHTTQANGFLRGTVTWDSGRSLLFADCRYRMTSQGAVDSHGNVASRYTATFAWNFEPDPHFYSCSLLRPVPASWEGHPGDGDIFATDFTYQNGQKVSARSVNGWFPGGWLKYDVTRDSKTGWITSSRDTAGLQTDYLYDSLGRPTKITPPGEAATVVSYPSPVQTIATRNGGAGLSTYEEYDYDGLGRTIRDRRLMPDGTYAKRFTKFDRAGNAYFESEWVADATSETLSANFATSCGFSGGAFSTSRPTSAPGVYRLCYDPFGRPQQVVGSMHSSLQTISHVDGSAFYSDTKEIATTACVNGTFSGGSCSGGTDSTTTIRKDAFGRSTSVIEPNLFTTSYGYDVNGKLTSVSQGAQSRSFIYDKFGFLRTETTPEKGTVTYDSIGSLGNVRQQTEPGNLVLSRSFDYAGRVTGVSSNEPRTYLTNVYDESGRFFSAGKLTTSMASNYYPSTGFTTAFFPGGKVTDSLYYSGVGGRLSQKKTTLSNGAASTIASWTYNGLGLVATESYPRIDSTGVFSVTTSYTAGLPTGMSANSGQPVVTSATYNPAGGLAAYTTGNGITTTIVPDPNQMPRPRRIYTSDLNFDTGNYVYDGRGNIRSQGSDAFVYDTNSRLLSATYPPTSQAYGYDVWGNLVQKAGTAIGVNLATNRLTGATYDLRGNVTVLGGESYSYDALNRQARHDAPTSYWGYLLDGANERIVKAIPPANGFVLRRDMARIILQARGDTPRATCAGYFNDVPCTDPERGWIEKFYELGITAGCSATPRLFCPDLATPRWQTAILLSQAMVLPGGSVPVSGTVAGVGSYNCVSGGTSLFADVAPTDVGCKFIHYLFAHGVTGGCSVTPRLFCPNDTTPDWQMEVFVSRAWNGFGYVPPGATYTFRGTGSSVLTEYQDSKVSKDYVYLGTRLVATNDIAAGRKYHATDHLGSVRLTTNAAGAVLERRKYWPWGEEAGPAGAGRMAFAGMELDLEATRPRYYDHARNLETGNGRFLSPDLLGGKIPDPQSWNRYTYARDNPLRLVDPDGLQSIEYLRRQAVELAWKQEQRAAISGGAVSRNWSGPELQQLISTGQVDGYIGHHINNVASRPDLAGDPANIRFATADEHYTLHNNGRYRLPTSGRLITRGVAFLQLAMLAVDAWSQYKEASATGITTSIFGTTAIFDAAAAARTLDGNFISVSEELGGTLQAHDGAFYRGGCGSGDDCRVDPNKLNGANFSVVLMY